MAGVYVALFAALALVGLGCWKWAAFAELWYCYRYEKTQDAVWREKLEKFGKAHPERPVSRWFYLMSYIHLGPDAEELPPLEEIGELPLPARQKALGLWLRERLKGDWAAEKCPVEYDTLFFPCLDSPEEWLPQVEILRDAMRRVETPPSSAGLAICDYGDVCLALALCGDDTGLPFLEDNLFNGTGCYPDDPSAITDCSQGPRGVVALAADGNARARRAVEKALTYRRIGGRVAEQMKAMLETFAGYGDANLEWLTERLAEYENRRAVEKASAEAKCRELAEDISRCSSAGYVLNSGEEGSWFTGDGIPVVPQRGRIVAGRVVEHAGSARAERLEVSSSGEWMFWASAIPQEEHLAFWRELLEFDLWTFAPPAPTHPAVASVEDPYEERCSGALVAFRMGERYRSFQRAGTLHRFLIPEDPSVLSYTLVRKHLSWERGIFNGFGTLSQEHTLEAIVDCWLRGEPWEEIVKKFPPPAPSSPSSVDE